MIQGVLKDRGVISVLVVVGEGEFDGIDERGQMVLLVARHDHLQEFDQVLFEALRAKDSLTGLDDSDRELYDLIEVREVSDNVLNEAPDLFEHLGIGIVLPLLQFLAIL